EWAEVVVGWNPVYTLKAKPGYIDSIYLSLKPLEHLQIWKHNHLPEHLNFGSNPRTLDLVVVADSSWSINWKSRDNRTNSGGAHGYDPHQMDMHAIFYAVGPAFRTNHEHQIFKNVDLYWLMATILGIEPVETDGVPERVKGMLAK
ncbi:MAG TPA: alkaline phosphatase family protein, partial [Bacteroidales bacterium]|nr:alkaline phosphatase family protein [Bacteroidales bacterium]